MKKIHYAWIEQILSFDTADEREAYIAKQKGLADRKSQADIQILSTGISMDNLNRYTLRIRKPYNGNPIYEGR